jgi:hypothetical protein
VIQKFGPQIFGQRAGAPERVALVEFPLERHKAGTTGIKVGTPLVTHLMGDQVAFDDIAGRRQDVGQEILALHDAVETFAVHTAVVDGIGGTPGGDGKNGHGKDTAGQHPEGHRIAPRPGDRTGRRAQGATPVHHLTLVQADAGLPLHAGIQGLGGGDLIAACLDAHRHVARVVGKGGDGGLHPVVAAILAPVLDDAAPRTPGHDGLPQIPERLFRHVGMTHDVVGLTDQLSALETTGKHKLVIARNDTTLEVGPADDGRPRFEGVFLLNDGQVLSHLFFLMALPGLTVTFSTPSL